MNSSPDKLNKSHNRDGNANPAETRRILVQEMSMKDAKKAIAIA
ncbi:MULTISPECIES: hypothetical protein [Leptolyngbya]|nr:hypothetical protein [Leptolyngbya sp. FACHB-1624]